MTTRARPSQERRPAAKASTAKVTAGVPGSGQARTVRVPWAFSAVPAIRRTIVADLVVRGVSAEVIDEAEIVVSELVANALRHAHALPDGTVRVHWKEKNGAVAFVEVASSPTDEEEDLRVRERSVEPDAHLVFDAPRVKPIPVDIRSAELGSGEEVGDLQGVEFTR